MPTGITPLAYLVQHQVSHSSPLNRLGGQPPVIYCYFQQLAFTGVLPPNVKTLIRCESVLTGGKAARDSLI